MTARNKEMVTSILKNRTGIKDNLEKSERWPKISKVKFNKYSCKLLPSRRAQILK